MKPLRSTAALLLWLIATNSYAQAPKSNPPKMADKPIANNMNKPATDQQSMESPFVATYSSQFEIGNYGQAQQILSIWKDWDDNTLDRHSDLFADTVVMLFANGQMIKGKEASLSAAKKARGGYTQVISSVDAFVPLRSTDRNENWVAVWGSDVSTKADGSKETVYLQEIWSFNKDGKINFVRQFTAQPPMGQ